jgi:S1-C subfamily serine protease
MQEDGNGSEQRSGWQPPEYVSPWASASGTGGEGEQGETVSFGMNPDEPDYQPTSPISWSADESAHEQEPESPPIWEAPAGPPPGGGGSWPGYGVPEMPIYDRQRGVLGRVLVYAAVAVLAAGVGAGAAVWLNGSSSNQSNFSSQSVPFPGSNSGNNNGGSGTAPGGALNQQKLASQVDPGIVDVTSTLSYNSETAEGTGMVLTPAGLVLTNNHVIDQATSVRATLVESGRSYSAKVVGYDSTDDVALLQLIGASGLKTVTLGNSDEVKIGQSVLALGNAQGRGGLPALAQGTISQLHRTISAGDASNSALTETLHDMIETDAPIQEGDSGGPLVDATGHVIGMDTAANTGSGQFGQGSTATTGFAIPINNALTIARQIDSGHATANVHIGLAGFMGVSVMNVNEAQTCLQDDPNLANGYTPPVNSGALVCLVQPGTPSASAGLTAGDIITAVNGKAVTSKDGLTSIIAPSHPGEMIHVTYYDANGKKHTIRMPLISIAR